jgi:NTP pyrophosphatase (non-canonical NTP hydrolase)
MNQRMIYQRAIDTFGEDHQLAKTIEECMELAVALMHYRDNKIPLDQVLQEVADVTIMMRQCALIFGEHVVDAHISYKMTRLDGVVKEHESLIKSIKGGAEQ